MKKEKKETLGEQLGIAGLYGLTDPELAKKMMFGDGSNRITGQLMTYATKERTADGRQIYAIFGIIAGPEGVLKEMHQYPVAGKPFGFPQVDRVTINISTQEGEDRTDLAGNGISGLMTKDIWRV